LIPLVVAQLATAGCASHQPGRTAIPLPSPAVRQLQQDLAAVFGAHINERGVWGVDIRSIDTGEHLFELNAGKLMMPASNLKILTLAATAEALGWDYRFTTTLETRGHVVNGILHGDLIVRGSGDPTINSRGNRADAVLSEWTRGLQAAGIFSIDGRIVGDDQAFDDEGIGAGWAWDYLQYGYAAPVGALEFNESLATLTVSPGVSAGDVPMVTLSAGSGLELVNHATTGAAGSPNTIDYRRHLDRAVLEVVGSIPAGTKPDTRSVAVVNPTLFLVQSVKDGLAARGLTITGEAVDFDDIAAEMPRGELRVLVASTSPPLREIATVLMKVSQNLYAETLLKALGASRNVLGTTEGGRIAVRATLTAWGIPGDAYVLYDGSGLSRYNYVTASAVADVLAHIYGDPKHRDAFVATLPIAGKDGTIDSRLKHTRAEGNAVAKTGSIANVRTLSGYVKTRDGETLVFSILANDFVIPSATIAWIADLGVEILSNFTRK
jgi:D-alanyl-D-alanine carboxypeptidase/D-alanyl-D-alanine-endopeptidase (penicillin-binding protein 4)